MCMTNKAEKHDSNNKSYNFIVSENWNDWSICKFDETVVNDDVICDCSYA